MKTSDSYAHDKQTILQRLSRIERQARGIARMVEEDRYCVDVLQHNGQTFYFCSKGCSWEFERSPATFLGAVVGSRD